MQVTDRAVRPIFIIGAPRSGTSIMTWALGQHPNIQTMPETTWIATMAAGSYISHEYGSSRGRFSHLSNVAYPLPVFMRRVGESVDQIVQDCFEERCLRLSAGGKGGKTVPAGEFRVRRSRDEPKQRWIDGTPYNTPFVWGLSQMFPDARFIHNLRKPHEVVTSLEAFDNVGAKPQQVEDGLSTWRSHAETAWLAERSLGAQRVFRLDFARISGEPEALMRDICSFIDEPYDPVCLLPLKERINSSQVDDRHEGNLARLRRLPRYLQAESLYQKMVGQPPSDIVDVDATEALRARFVEHCRTRPLL